jgi:N-acetylneuraminic acid mutarotase
MQRLNGNRMGLVVVGIVAGIVIGGGRAKADFTWKQKADMPTPRWGNASAVVNGKIYVIGGGTSQDEPNERLLSTVEEYDPSTDTWTTKSDMPTARFGLSTCVVNGKIYAIGGDSWPSAVRSAVEEYDPATDTWTRKTDMPTGRDYLATVAVDEKIYAIGGTLSYSSGFFTVEVYDPATDTWTTKADMSMRLWGLCAHVVNGKIYTFGGRSGLKAKARVKEYDPATDTWTGKADMPVATSQMDSVVMDNKIVVIGGWLWSMNYPYRTVQIYDPETDTWTIEEDAPFQRAVFSAEVVNNRIYVIGGTDRPHPCPALSTVYEFGPVLDLNSDGIVDAVDICIMVDHWGTDYSLCDIAPPPFGDGVVDVEDLKVLAEHLFEEVPTVGLVAHWKLDEKEGMVVTDSAGDNNGYALGDPIWQPDGGQVGGALEFDGIDDFISTPAALNPSDGPFSVLLWVQGGGPGQGIICENNGPCCLCLDQTAGNVMTELANVGRSAAPLISQTVINDGTWHRIGLVWDGSNRILCVDDAIVAQDTQDGLDSTGNGLYIGCGDTLQPDTFFSGLIDDVRIYNRAVSP